jgi:hypothetical protein
MKSTMHAMFIRQVVAANIQTFTIVKRPEKR